MVLWDHGNESIMEFYEATYFILLIPSVVITVIFFFFWIFVKETLYEKVLAKQKREQKLIPTKNVVETSSVREDYLSETGSQDSQVDSDSEEGNDSENRELTGEELEWHFSKLQIVLSAPRHPPAYIPIGACWYGACACDTSAPQEWKEARSSSSVFPVLEDQNQQTKILSACRF